MPEPIDQTTDQFPILQEQYVCPGCESAIPQYAVVSRYPRTVMDPVRVIQVICPHCNRAYARPFTLSGGNWVPIGEVSLITDARVRTGIQRQIDKRLGTRLAAC